MLTARRRFADERGVTIVLFALILVVLLGIAGMVVDLALVRSDRQRNKSSADVAVTAGLQALNNNGLVAPFRGACAAVDYLRANHGELSALTSSSGTWTNGASPPAAIAGGDPCQSGSTAYTNYYNSQCSGRSSFAWFTATVGSVTVKVRAGYDQSDFTADGFSDDIGHSDYGDATKLGCDQLAVIVTEREQAGFGRVLGGSQMATTIRSVGRVNIGSSNNAAIALLLLERDKCDSLKIGGQNSYVVVHGTGSRPGIAHSDSIGNDTGTCYVFRGSHTNGIVAEQAPVGAAHGIVSVAALAGLPLANPTKAYDSASYVVAQGAPAPGPEAHVRVGRAPVDNRYLGLGSPATGITKVSNDATAAFALNAGNAGGAGYNNVYTNCNSLPNPIPGPKVFIGCSLTKTTTFDTNVTDVVIKGNIDINGGGNPTITIPNARNVYVYGDTASNGKGVSLGSQATLNLNMNGATTCAQRFTNNRLETTKLVVGNGQFTAGSSAVANMCSTTLVLLDNAIPTTSGTIPSNVGGDGYISVSAGAKLSWTAPDVSDTDPTAAQLSNLEDLALWTETETGSNINGSNADTKLSGVFFAPNNRFTINAGTGGITANAQFIVRTLTAGGSGSLDLTANPADSVPAPFIDSFRLVR